MPASGARLQLALEFFREESGGASDYCDDMLSGEVDPDADVDDKQYISHDLILDEVFIKKI